MSFSATHTDQEAFRGYEAERSELIFSPLRKISLRRNNTSDIFTEYVQSFTDGKWVTLPQEENFLNFFQKNLEKEE